MPGFVWRALWLTIALAAACAAAPRADASDCPAPPAPVVAQRDASLADVASEPPPPQAASAVTCADRAPAEPISKPRSGWSSGSCEQNDAAEAQVRQLMLGRWRREFPKSRIDVAFDCMPVGHRLETIVYTDDRGQPESFIFMRESDTSFRVLSIRPFRPPRFRSEPKRPPFAIQRGRLPAAAVDAISDRLRASVAVTAREVRLDDTPGVGHGVLSADHVSVALHDERNHAGRSTRAGTSDMRTVLPMTLVSELLQPLTKVAREALTELDAAERELLFPIVWNTAGHNHPVRSIATAIELAPLFEREREVPLLLELIDRTKDHELLAEATARLGELTGFVPPRDPAFKQWNAATIAAAYRRACRPLWIRE